VSPFNGYFTTILVWHSNKGNHSFIHSWSLFYGCNMLQAYAHPVVTCCHMLDVVGLTLKMVQFSMQPFWMLHDVVLVWPSSCSSVALGMHTSSPTCPNKSQQGGQQRNTLRQRWCDMLRWNVALAWTRLANSGPTILRYAGFKCRDLIHYILHEKLRISLTEGINQQNLNFLLWICFHTRMKYACFFLPPLVIDQTNKTILCFTFPYYITLKDICMAGYIKAIKVCND